METTNLQQNDGIHSVPTGGDSCAADVHSASDEYAARFSGEAGKWLLSVQSKVLLDVLKEIGSGATVLDVGGGHGQVAIPLAHSGFKVTVLASSEAGLKQVAEAKKSGLVQTQIGDLLSLPYASKEFDVVVCFRLMPHCDEWPKLISELCRVSRHAVVVDYPTWQSVNILSPLTFKLKKQLEGNTRTFTLFSHSQIRAAFVDAGFRPSKEIGQFFFPMVIHRLLKNARISNMLEGLSTFVLLNKFLGSPVIARFDRTILPE